MRALLEELPALAIGLLVMYVMAKTLLFYFLSILGWFI